MTARYLADKSAYGVRNDGGSSRLAELMGQDLVASCAVVNLALLYTAQNPRAYEAARAELLAGLEEVPIDQRVVERALEVQRLLVARRRHRVAQVTDLLVASAAELAGLSLLHSRGELEAIAEVTGQPHEVIGSPAPADDRRRPYVVLVGQRGSFELTTQIEAISSDDAIEQAVENGLVVPAEALVVAVPLRLWNPAPVMGDPED